MKRRFMVSLLTTAFVLAGTMCLHMDASAAQLPDSEAVVSAGDSAPAQGGTEVPEGDTAPETTVPVQDAVYVDIPHVKGLPVEEAQAKLLALDFGGNNVEILLQYEYSELPADTVAAQSLTGQADAAGISGIVLTVSLGTEPEEDLLDAAQLNKTGSFGLAAYTETSPITIDGDFGDWEGMPYSWEYTWDNSQSCWVNGYWEEGLNGYKTPHGTYDENVRHKVSLYTDGEYAYLYIKFARCYVSRFNGYNHIFSVGDSRSDKTQFNITNMENGDIIEDIRGWGPGVYEVLVKHGDGAVSWQNVKGSKAYVKVNETTWNAELELKIPLSEMQVQNPGLNLERIDKLSWECPGLTYRRVYAAGASTAPFVAAGLALVGVPLTGAAVKKRRDRKGNA